MKIIRLLAGLTLTCLLTGLSRPAFSLESQTTSRVDYLLNKSMDEPDLSEILQTKERFHKAIAYSYHPTRSGQLFFLTRKYFPIMFQSADYSQDGYSFIRGNKVANRGATHGMVWDYDIEIPLVFYGAGRVKENQKIDTPIALQDLAPTYAHLIGAIPPKDALHGRFLHQPFLKQAKTKAPKAILTVVFDQGGWQYYRAQPGAWPNVKALMKKGTTYTRAQIQHLDVETAVGHTAIGTGAFPYQHGILSNHFPLPPIGSHMSLLGPDRSPIFINSPSLADVWDLQTQNKAFIFSYAYAERAAIGMAGHGAMFHGGDKDMVLAYNNKTGTVGINEKYYAIPDYLRKISIKPYLDQIMDKDGHWFGHAMNNLVDVNKTPAQAMFDAEVFLTMLEHEAIGQDNITDLLYLTLKSTDACGHAFGSESDECRTVLMEQDKQLKRVIEALEKKVGKENILVVLTADHGGSPLLGENLNGHVLSAEKIKADLNQALDQVDNDIPLIYDMLASQIYVDEAELKRNGLSWEHIRQALLNYEAMGQPAFLDVLTRRDVTELQLKYQITD